MGVKVDEERRTRARDNPASAHRMIDDGESETSAVLSFDDNRLASLLFGQHDRNLIFLERRLGIEAVARGNHVSLRGSSAAVGQAQRILQTLSERAKAGHAIEPGDVDGALRLIDRAPPSHPPNRSGRPSSEVATVGTRKKTIAARTLAQNAYIKALQSHELTFAAGPAGTGKTYLAVACAVEAATAGPAANVTLLYRRDVFNATPEALARVRAIVGGGEARIDAALMDQCPKLEVITICGVGYDGVDVTAAGAKGVIVTNTPDVLNDEVADTTIALLLNTIRQFHFAERYLREGRWERDLEAHTRPAQLPRGEQ